MEDVYVAIGNRYLRESMEEGTGREGYVGLIVREDSLENTYQGFLEKCCAAIAQSTVNPEQQPTYNAIQDALHGREESVKHSVLLNNRPERKYRIFDLADRVEDSAGEFLYTTKHNVDNKEVSMRTLEMYVLSGGIGG